MSSATAMSTSGLGASPRRVEDHRLLTGRGRYASDDAPPGALHGVVLRAPVGHADFRLTGLDAARAMPGIAAILTHADVAELGSLPAADLVSNADGSRVTHPPYPVLPRDRVRHVGEAVAFIVAETAIQARDAAEAVRAAFEERPAVSTIDEALAEGASLVWPERGSNVAYDSHIGDRAATEAAFAAAALIVDLDVVNNRLVCNYMEPRAALASYDPGTDGYTLTVGSQGVHAMRQMLCGVLRIPQERMRVITPPDVGGGFGTRFFLYREYALACVAARVTGRTVRWLSDRSEHFLADAHGRDHRTAARMAFDESGRILGMEVDLRANLGAYASFYGAFVPFNGAFMSPGCYHVPALSVRVRGVYTNTMSVDAYRGAGRPEATFLIERLMDKAARELGVAQDQLRRLNFVTPSQMPHRTATGRVYDSGDFDGHMRRALEAADWDGFADRWAKARRGGRLRGIGLAVYIEACAGPTPETARIAIGENGRATIFIGYQASGQGHETAYAQIAAAHTGLPLGAFDLVQGDTQRVATGSGTGGSRSVTTGGVVIDGAARRLAVRIRKHAAEILEVADADVELADGHASVVGSDRRVTMAAVARRAAEAGDLLEDSHRYAPDDFTYPNGTHVVEAEVDPETGRVAILRYTIVDDFGGVVNPMLLEGSIHGGVAQGLGQALMERTVYEAGSGQLLTASFMDYAMPRAGDLPFIAFETRNVPCRNNLLGLKGAGEAGAIGATPAVVNAIVDALHRHNGVTQLAMPTTPETVWRAIRSRPACVPN